MPQPSAAAYVIGFFVIAIVLGNIAIWARVLARWLADKPAISFEPRRPAPWGLLDAAIILGLWFLLTGAMAEISLRWGVETIPSGAHKIAQYRNLMLVQLLANLCTIGYGVARLAGRGMRLVDFGLVGRSVGRDVRLGLLAFVAAVVPVYGLQYVLVQFWPSEHPLIVLLKETPDRWIILLSVLSAAIVAPIVEEFLFRLVLQGAIETAEWRALTAANPSFQVDDHAPADSPQTAAQEFAPNIESTPADSAQAADARIESANPYQAPSVPGDASLENPLTEEPGTLVRSLSNSKVWGLPMGVWPMTISATIFALLHARGGPDPVPLLLLALIMGYLYRQTHRLLPSIVLHMTLNSCSLILLWLQLGG